MCWQTRDNRRARARVKSRAREWTTAALLKVSRHGLRGRETALDRPVLAIVLALHGYQRPHSQDQETTKATRTLTLGKLKAGSGRQQKQLQWREYR